PQLIPGLDPAPRRDLQHLPAFSPEGIVGPHLVQAIMQDGEPGEPELFLLLQLAQAGIANCRGLSGEGFATSLLTRHGGGPRSAVQHTYTLPNPPPNHRPNAPYLRSVAY